MKGTENLLISVSGGRSSAMMAHHIFNSEKYINYKKCFVFANTGQEKKETIDFIKNMIRFWGIPVICIEGVYSEEKGVGVKHKVVEINNLNMDSEPLTGAIIQVNKYGSGGVFSTSRPYCSEYTKKRPIDSFAKEYFKGEEYTTAIGYRLEDTPKRISFAELRNTKKILCPLLTDYEKPISKFDVTYFFDDQPFKLSIKSDLGNCELCWKKGDKNLVNALKNGVKMESIQFYIKAEKKYNDTFFRQRRSIYDIIKLANETGFQKEISFDDDSCICFETNN